ncbi:MAG: hypothetical protein IPI42_14755 [Saprospiraceae bacterium]|nr:hypothetical protein [Candidatus Parvibacillus calidus]
MEITDYSYSIPTFALQLLVENAIKHNVISETHPLQINLDQDMDIIKVANKIQNKMKQIFLRNRIEKSETKVQVAWRVKPGNY